ncbi:MAG: hypothetical protein GX299_08540 [Epulopiscium sp.]|nr:hypothetical protein [Candidatus Epulonipiscium sp.]
MGEPDAIITVEGCNEETEKANAKLLAAAPEMYQALKDITEARGACVLSANDPVDREFDRVAKRAKAVIDRLER